VVKQGELKVGSLVEAKVDMSLRAATAQNHSVTHLLHAALRNIVGQHVEQKGSLVAPDRLRFDFTHFSAVSPEQLEAVENKVNQDIRRNLMVETHLTSPEQAKSMGAMALFGEKYGETVRVLKMGDASMELCGGTHVKRTGDIGFFKILSESGIASGVRRIEAVSGEKAVAFVHESERLLSQLSSQLKSNRAELMDKFTQALDKQRKLEKELEQLKLKMAGVLSQELMAEASQVNGIRCLIKQVSGIESKSLKDLVEQLRNRLGECVLLLSVVENNQVSLVAAVSKDLSQKIKAGELVNFVAQQVGGKGGGRPDFAQAGGSDPSQLEKALASAQSWVNEKL
jgi:alanyl-tRNA synthetase